MADETSTAPRQRASRVLVRVAASAFGALVKAVLTLALALPLLLAWLWRWLQERLKEGFRDQDKEQADCKVPFPEDLMRRPDPCIYSQWFLEAQGFPVTWDNPDIWMARKATPGVVEPDSYHLLENTDYIVSVQAHNAGTDLAVGVRVRLVYRPWSFNSPDLTPVEVDAGGHEVFRIVNIPPMGSAITTFAWHTPAVGPESSHFCLQAMLSHPMDVNPGNNLGQENTQVLDTDGQTAHLLVPLHNPARVAQRLAIAARHYRIVDDEQVELRLKYNRGRAPDSALHRLARLVPAIAVDAEPAPETALILPGLVWSNAPTPTKAKYVGLEPLRDRLRKHDDRLPAGMEVAIHDYDGGVTLAAGETRVMQIAVTPPPGAPVGAEFPINLVARDQGGRLAGGVTVLLRIQG